MSSQFFSPESTGCAVAATPGSAAVEDPDSRAVAVGPTSEETGAAGYPQSDALPKPTVPRSPEIAMRLELRFDPFRSPSEGCVGRSLGTVGAGTAGEGARGTVFGGGLRGMVFGGALRGMVFGGALRGTLLVGGLAGAGLTGGSRFVGGETVGGVSGASEPVWLPVLGAE